MQDIFLLPKKVLVFAVTATVSFIYKMTCRVYGLKGWESLVKKA
jgi:hypothetical protein